MKAGGLAMSLKIIGQVLLAALALASVPSCGGGNGSSSPESQTASAISNLDQSALAGNVTGAEFATGLDEILAAVDGRTDGVAKLSLYFQNSVVGVDLMTQMLAREQTRSAKTAQETLNDIQSSQAYLMLDAFVSTVAANLLISDPANMLLEFARPEIFLAAASVTIRAQIYEALVNGLISPEEAEELYEMGRQNPWKAKHALMVKLSQTPPAWVITVAAPCLRGCEPTGDTTVYSGPFSKVFNASNGDCTWQEVLLGTIEVVVTGRGTVSDPFEGSMDVTGQIDETLIGGSYCAQGGTYRITSFDGTVFGSDGKLYGEGEGDIGTGRFYAALNAAAVTSTAVAGGFDFQVGEETLQMTVTLHP